VERGASTYPNIRRPILGSRIKLTLLHIPIRCHIYLECSPQRHQCSGDENTKHLKKLPSFTILRFYRLNYIYWEPEELKKSWYFVKGVCFLITSLRVV
jgi:hypothetical protein